MKNKQDDKHFYGEPFYIEKILPQHFYNFILATTGFKKFHYYESAIKLRPYQMKAGWCIINSVINNLAKEILVEFSRQSGKSEMNADVVYFLSCLPTLYKPFADNGLKAGIFAPKKDQSDIIFNRIKERFDDGFAKEFLGIDIIKSNQKELYLSNKSYIHCSTASIMATIEGLTLDYAIIEEAQDVDDLRLKKSIFPMMASTHGTRVLSGTATPERKGYFYYQLMKRKRSKDVFIYDYLKTMKYSKKYAAYVEKEKKRYGEDSIEFQTQFALKWRFDVTNYTTEEQLFPLRKGSIVEREMEKECYFGQDIGRAQSSSITTIFDSTGRILNWLETDDPDYEVQKEIIISFLSNYNIIRGVVDSFGPGAPIANALGRIYEVESFEPTTPNNSEVNIDFQRAIRNPKKSGFSYPSDPSTERYRFEEQMTDMTVKWKGNLMMCHKPKRRGARDDYCKSASYGWRALTQEGVYLGVSTTTRGEVEEESHANI